MERHSARLPQWSPTRLPDHLLHDAEFWVDPQWGFVENYHRSGPLHFLLQGEDFEVFSY